MTPPASSDDWAPAACTLPTSDRPLRLAEFDALFATALRSADRAGRTDLTLTLTAAPGRVGVLRDLIRRETECCSFFEFRLEEGDPLRLLVTVPAAYADVLDALATRADRLVAGTPRGRTLGGH
jgi:hypothetical protein